MSHELIKKIHVITGILLLVSILTGNNIGIITIVVLVLVSTASAPIIAHVRGVTLDLPIDRHRQIIYSESWSNPAMLWVALTKCPGCQLAPCGGRCLRKKNPTTKSGVTHQYIIECADRFRETVTK